MAVSRRVQRNHVRGADVDDRVDAHRTSRSVESRTPGMGTGGSTSSSIARSGCRGGADPYGHHQRAEQRQVTGEHRDQGDCAGVPTPCRVPALACRVDPPRPGGSFGAATRRALASRNALNSEPHPTPTSVENCRVRGRCGGRGRRPRPRRTGPIGVPGVAGVVVAMPVYSLTHASPAARPPFFRSSPPPMAMSSSVGTRASPVKNDPRGRTARVRASIRRNAAPLRGGGPRQSDSSSFWPAPDEHHVAWLTRGLQDVEREFATVFAKGYSGCTP